MRVLLSFAACSAVGLPGGALAQETLHLLPVPALAPLPKVQPTADAPPPVAALPAPAHVEPAPAPAIPTETPAVAPVLVQKEKDKNVAGKVGVVVGGVAGGAAGAAVGGPVGKFAGGFLGKKLVQGIFGDDKDKVPEVTVAEPTPAQAAEDQGGAKPPRKESWRNA